MTRTLSLAVATRSGFGSVAYATPPNLSPRQQAWVRDVNACLVEKGVVITGTRPECFINDNLRIMCLTERLRAIGAACNQQHLPPAQNRL